MCAEICLCIFICSTMSRLVNRFVSTHNADMYISDQTFRWTGLLIQFHHMVEKHLY